jgi:hypothetical protein
MLTRDTAIAKLVEHDVAKWGEAERVASQRMRSQLSHGRALNTLAHIDLDHIDEDMARDALSVMTTQDHRDLRDGG